MLRYQLPGLYPITDARLAGVSHAEQVARLSEGGARLVQLREKHLAPRQFYEEAKKALVVARACGVLLIINDRVDIAMAIGADGIHLGQDDLEPLAARKLLGPEAIIGYSIHNVGQARAAAHLPVDYLAVGPIYATASKENPDPVIGLDGLRRVRQTVGRHMFLVAIGGIVASNAMAVLAAGADSVAVIGALVAGDARDITGRTQKFLAELEPTGFV